MSNYADGVGYATGLTSERAEAERRQSQQLSDAFRELEQWQAVFRGKLEHGCRHGRSEAVMKQINDASAEVGSCITRIMGLMPVLALAAPRKNRY